MKSKSKTCGILFRVYVRIDNLLYKTFGVVTPVRKMHWKNKAAEIQKLLNKERKMKEFSNSFFGTDYTTKKAISQWRAKGI